MDTRRISVKAVFDHAIEIESADDRRAYLDQACADDPDARQKVEALLRAYEEAGSFMESGPPGLAGTVEHPRITEGPGSLIGPYKLLQQIGEGAFGVVYMAEQREPVRRKVALKIIKPGMDTQQVIARFEAERQALAMMEHPNIARVLDAGATDSGRPYFVMELVKGVPITEYCDKNDLSTAERLRLFITVCQAVQHAHQKGVIHRDLKPTNIMVTLHDGQPVAKVIDFGVSKAINQQLTEKTLFTHYGQMVGTPQYMSPEQAEMSGLDVDTRADVYSLGVLLYELLTGTTPLESERLHAAGYAEMQRIICEEDPPRPSVRLSSADQQQLTVIAKHRSADPRQLRQQIRGELDWIVMKSLEKERGRRYETATALAADVERFLQDEPVEACSPSTAYRVRKFIRRNKLPVTAAISLSLALVVGITGTSIGLYLAKREAIRVGVALADVEEARELANRVALDATEAEHLATQESERRRRLLYVADMNAALQALNENDIRRVRELLDRYALDRDDDLRGFEWYYLWARSHQRGRRIELPSKANFVALSRGGTRLAIAHRDGFVTVWDVRTKELEDEFPALNSWDTFVAFSPTDNVVAFPAPDSFAVVLRDLDSAEEQRVGHDARVAEVAFSPDGESLASVSVDGTVRLCYLKTRNTQRTLDKHAAQVTAVAFSPNGRFLAWGTDDGVAKVWDLVGDEIAMTFTATTVKTTTSAAPEGKKFFSLAFSPSSRTLAAACGDTTVRLWNLDTKQETILTGHTDQARTVAFLPDGSTLASGGRDNAVRLWDLATCTQRDALIGHTSAVQSLAISSDGGLLATGSADLTAMLWEIGRQNEMETLEVEAPIQRMAFSPGGSLLALVEEGMPDQTAFPPDDPWDTSQEELAQSVRLLNTGDHQGQLPSLTVQQGIRSIAVSAGGVLAVATGEQEVRLWNITTQKEYEPIRSETAVGIAVVAFAANGELLVAGMDNGHLSGWDSRDRKRVFSFKVGQQSVKCLAVSPDGQTAAVVTGDEKTLAKVWDLNSGQLLHTIVGDAGFEARSLAFSPHGKILAVGYQEGRIQLWEPSSSGNVHILLGHSIGVTALAFSPDGRRLFSSGWDRTVRVWDLATRQQCFTFGRHPRHVRTIALSPDGKTLVSSSSRMVRFWHAARDEDVRAVVR